LVIAAGTGGAVLAKFAWWKHTNGGSGTFEEMTDGDVGRMKLVAEPRKEIERIYAGLVNGYRSCEDAVVHACCVNA
jgi:xylulokinase